LLGVGPGNFGEFTRDSVPELFPNDLAIVNNEPLELLAETGAIGSLLFALFVLSSFWLAVKKLARDGVRAQPWLLGLLLCLIGYAVQYQTFSTLYLTHVWVTIGLLLGYLLASETVRKETEPRAADAA